MPFNQTIPQTNTARASVEVRSPPPHSECLKNHAFPTPPAGDEAALTESSLLRRVGTWFDLDCQCSKENSHIRFPTPPSNYFGRLRLPNFQLPPRQGKS